MVSATASAQEVGVGTTPKIEERSRAWRTWAKRLGPWILTGGVTLYILSQNPLSQIIAEMQRGDVTLLLPLAIWVTLQGLLVAGLADLFVIRAAAAAGEGRSPRYLDVVVAKAGVGVLEAVGYALGRGGYGVWIARAAGTGAGLAAGAVLYIVLSDLGAVTTVGALSIYLGGAEVPDTVAVIVPAVAVAVWLLTLLAPGWPWDIRRLPRPLRPLVRLRRRTAAPQIALRVFNIAFGTLMTWVAARAFGLEIPLAAVAVYLPVIMVIGSLPINIAGLGPVQGAWLLFFGSWASGPQILAFQFLWTVSILLAVVLRGLPAIGRVTREIADGTPPAD